MCCPMGVNNDGAVAAHIRFIMGAYPPWVLQETWVSMMLACIGVYFLEHDLLRYEYLLAELSAATYAISAVSFPRPFQEAEGLS